jgi:DNA-binding protein YbaB
LLPVSGSGSRVEAIGVESEFPASVDGLMKDYTERAKQLIEMRKKLDEAVAIATAGRGDGLVTVVVGPHGQVRDVRIDPKAYRKLTPSELSESIMKLIAEATADVTHQMQEILAPFIPEGLSYDEVLGEEGDFTKLLPSPPRIPDF